MGGFFTRNDGSEIDYADSVNFTVDGITCTRDQAIWESSVNVFREFSRL